MKRWGIVIGVIAVVGVLALGWAAWSMQSAEQHLQAAREHLLDARSAISDLDSDAALAAVDNAKVESNAAADLAGNPVWALMAAVPKVGDTPEAARSLVLAADAAVTGVSGVAEVAGQLAAGDVYKDGQVDVSAVTAAGAAAISAGESLQVATSYLDLMPTAATGGWVPARIDGARTELVDQIEELTAATDAVEKVGAILPGILGADGPKRYLVAVQSPNETRGTGGIVGTWAVLEVDQGRIAVSEVGSNREIPTLAAMPDSMDTDYVARYGQDPRKFDNMNLSPDFPSAATMWRAGWKAARGEALDGVLGLDVLALGDLLAGSGVTLEGPDGDTLSGEQFAEFALEGLYRKFPTDAQTPARKAYQEALAKQALKGVLGASDPTALLRAMSDPVRERRVAAWMEDSTAQAAIADSVLGHGLQPARAHSVEPIVINAGWSKLDSYIERAYDYEVGRCPDEDGRVESQLSMTLTSDLPEGTDLPEYVIGAVPVGPDGPVNRVVLQAHLPPGAEILEVTVDGESFSYWPFTEAGRPAFGELLELPPRQPREVQVTFIEPADDVAGVVISQPMAREASITVSDSGC